MVKFVDIDPKDIDTARLGRRGRVSYPIVKSFMERNVKLSMLDITGLDKNPTYFRSALGAYIKSHKLPIRVFSAGGDIHMMRLDLDNDNNPIPGWEYGLEATEGSAGDLMNDTPDKITADTVSARSKGEKGKSTK